MALFDFFKKKTPAASRPATAPAAPRTDAAGEYLDDITFIQEIKHIPAGPWHQYDVLLAARGYGWEMMLGWADYMAGADLEHISEVTAGALGAGDRNITASWQASGSCRKTPELAMEAGFLSIAGISKALKAPMKIVWINQTRVLRFFTLLDDEQLIRRYAETVVRRSFGTENAMKPGKPLPKGK